MASVAGANEVALLMWSPLSGGYLSGKYTAGRGGVETGRRARLNFLPIDQLQADLIVFELRKIALEFDSVSRTEMPYPRCTRQFHDKDRVLT
jgi:aryl-alcohol dehydrogenase-like predicted oxidoreductase